MTKEAENNSALFAVLAFITLVTFIIILAFMKPKCEICHNYKATRTCEYGFCLKDICSGCTNMCDGMGCYKMICDTHIYGVCAICGIRGEADHLMGEL